MNFDSLFKKNAKMWFALIQKSKNNNLLIYVKFDKRAIVNFNRIKSWLKSIVYERDNLIKFYLRINISWRDVININYRVEKITINIVFRIWQIIVINFMLKNLSNSFVKICILKNYMNIEKIVKILRFQTIINIFSFYYNNFYLLVFTWANFSHSQLFKCSRIFFYFIEKIMLERLFSNFDKFFFDFFVS